jgi:hypothetical protein
LRFRPSAALLLSLFVAACGPAIPASRGAPSPLAGDAAAAASLRAAAALITAESVRGHIEYLASDELLGRDTPSPGLEAAALYLADRFQAMGL